jgi:hypothetical protein
VGANDSTRAASRVISACQNLNPGLLESTCIVFHGMRDDPGGMLGSWGGNTAEWAGWLGGVEGRRRKLNHSFFTNQSIYELVHQSFCTFGGASY